MKAAKVDGRKNNGRKVGSGRYGPSSKRDFWLSDVPWMHWQSQPCPRKYIENLIRNDMESEATGGTQPDEHGSEGEERPEGGSLADSPVHSGRD